jgi:hypothetical protein
VSSTYIPANLRRAISDRAQNRCEYCLLPSALSLASHQVDHVIAEKHGGLTLEINLALSCSLCNQAKGSDIASIDLETGEIVRLFNPRQDEWTDHFQIEKDSGKILPLTKIGSVTVKLLQMNCESSLPTRLLLSKAGILE